MTIATNWVDGIGMEVDADYLNEAGGAINANTAARTLVGTFAARPAAASSSGAVYFCTDCDAVYRSDGATWQKVRMGAYAGPPMADPPPAGWVDINLGSDTSGTDKDAQTLTVASGAGINQKLRVRTLAPAINYAVTAYLDANYPLPTQAAYIAAGLVLRDSASGKYIAMYAGDTSSTSANPAMVVQTFNGPTAVVAVLASAPGLTLGITPTPPPKWMRIRDDGATRYWEYSFDGKYWATLYSGSRTEFITADQIGFMAWNAATGQTMTAQLRSLVFA